jgi:pilus assembly protein Flp/PilA
LPDFLKKGYFAMLKKKLGSLLRREEGVTATEYAIILALVAVAIVTVVTTLGTDIKNVFSSAAGAI